MGENLWFRQANKRGSQARRTQIQTAWGNAGVGYDGREPPTKPRGPSRASRLMRPLASGEGTPPAQEYRMSDRFHADLNKGAATVIRSAHRHRMDQVRRAARQCSFVRGSSSLRLRRQRIPNRLDDLTWCRHSFRMWPARVADALAGVGRERCAGYEITNAGAGRRQLQSVYRAVTKLWVLRHFTHS
jgi:hypothetical protein